MVRLGLCVAVLVVAGACALFDDGPPENICRTDEECFRAQGEVCDLEAQRCVQGDGVDAGVDAPADATVEAF